MSLDPPQTQPVPCAVPSLKQLCLTTIARNLNRFLNLNGTPYYHVKRLLLLCNSRQLERLEALNPYIAADSDEIWEVRCRNDFHYDSKEVEAADGTYRSQYKLLKANYEKRLEVVGEKLRRRYKQFEERKEARKIVCLDAPVQTFSVFGSGRLVEQSFRTPGMRMAYSQARDTQRWQTADMRFRRGMPYPHQTGQDSFPRSSLGRPNREELRVQVYSSISEMLQRERSEAALERELRSSGARRSASERNKSPSQAPSGRKRMREPSEDAIFGVTEGELGLDDDQKLPAKSRRVEDGITTTQSPRTGGSEESPRTKRTVPLRATEAIRPQRSPKPQEVSDKVYVPSETDRAASSAFDSKLTSLGKITASKPR